MRVTEFQSSTQVSLSPSVHIFPARTTEVAPVKQKPSSRGSSSQKLPRRFPRPTVKWRFLKQRRGNVGWATSVKGHLLIAPNRSTEYLLPFSVCFQFNIKAPRLYLYQTQNLRSGWRWCLIPLQRLHCFVSINTAGSNWYSALDKTVTTVYTQVSSKQEKSCLHL